MEPKHRAARPRTDFSYVAAPTLISALTLTGDRPDVRLMEELLARGPEWEPGIVAALNHALYSGPGDRDPPPNPLWLAVVAGVMRAAGVVPGLLRMLRAAPEHDVIALLVAAEAPPRSSSHGTTAPGRCEALTKRARSRHGVLARTP